MKKKGIFIILTLIIIIVITILFFLMKFQGVNERENIIKIIRNYIDKEEYERALDNVEALLRKNPEDQEALALQDEIIELKNTKKDKDELAKDEKEKLDREKLLESMNTLIDKTDEKPQIIIQNQDEKYKSQDNKENEKLQKLKTYIKDGINDYNSQNYAKAKDNFLKALDIDDNNTDANAYLGITLYDENPNSDQNVQEAIRKLKKALKSDNTNVEAQYKLAKIYDDQNLYDAAIEEYKKTLSLDPNRYEAYFSLGKIYYNQREYKNAEDNFKACIKLKPNYVNALVYLGSTELKINKTPEAKFYFNKALSYDSKFYQAHSMLGEVYKTEKDYQTALIHYKKAAELTNLYRYHQKIGECYDGLKQYPKAAESFLTAVSLNPLKTEKEKADAVEAYESLAELEKNRGNYKESLAYVKKGMDLDSKSSFLYYVSAFDKSRLGQTEEAINDYLTAIDLNMNDITSYINLSKIYNETNRFDESVNISLRGIRIDGNQYKLYNNLGDSYQKTNKYTDAIDAYKLSIKLNPSDAVIYFNLGICYTELKDYENAVPAFQQTININSGYHDAYYELGQSYFTLKKYPEAKAIFNNLLQKKPDYSKRDQIDRMLAVIGG